MGRTAKTGQRTFQDIRVFMRKKPFTTSRHMPAPAMLGENCGSTSRCALDPECPAVAKPSGKRGGVRLGGAPVETEPADSTAADDAYQQSLNLDM
eukprot:2401713-Pyramimonas_sp.AAC.1